MPASIDARVGFSRKMLGTHLVKTWNLASGFFSRKLPNTLSLGP